MGLAQLPPTGKLDHGPLVAGCAVVLLDEDYIRLHNDDKVLVIWSSMWSSMWSTMEYYDVVILSIVLSIHYRVDYRIEYYTQYTLYNIKNYDSIVFQYDVEYDIT